MALNPPLNQDGTPLALNGEYFLLKRSHVEFEIEYNNKVQYKGKGYVLLLC